MEALIERSLLRLKNTKQNERSVAVFVLYTIHREYPPELAPGGEVAKANTTTDHGVHIYYQYVAPYLPLTALSSNVLSAIFCIKSIVTTVLYQCTSDTSWPLKSTPEWWRFGAEPFPPSRGIYLNVRYTAAGADPTEFQVRIGEVVQGKREE